MSQLERKKKESEREQVGVKERRKVLTKKKEKIKDNIYKKKMKEKTCHFSLCKKISWRRNGKCELRNNKKSFKTKKNGGERGGFMQTKTKKNV